MNAVTTTKEEEDKGREPVLDTIERVSEMCFGLFMALTFVGAVSVATGAGEKAVDAGRTMLATALGCNLAWGLVDAVMVGEVHREDLLGDVPRHACAARVHRLDEPAPNRPCG